MTDEQRTAVLSLYGLTSLDEATQENWEWWHGPYPNYTKSEKESANKGRFQIPTGPEKFIPYMPDFHWNDGAAVKLQSRMARIGQVHVVTRLDPDGDVVYIATWELDDPDGGWSTSGSFWDERYFLGEALLAALEAEG